VKVIFKMSGKRDTASAALQRSAHFLAPQHHDAILDSLQAEGLLDDLPKNSESGGRVRAAATDNAPKGRPLLTPLQCSQARGGANRDLLHSVIASVKRLGFQIDISDKHVDIDAFNAATKGKSVTERLAAKAAMFRLGLIA
jgi:hypothetical protein